MQRGASRMRGFRNPVLFSQPLKSSSLPAQPAVHRVPGNLLHSGNRRFVHTLDAESRHLIEGSSAMLEPVIDCPPIPAEGSAAPAGWVGTKSNDRS